ncbi:MAG: (2Fe-2S) ferredoxin domain-containing protein [Chloroflexota bacterium]
MSDDFGPQARWRVHLCQGPNCSRRGARELMPILRDAVERAGLASEVEIIAATCRDRCDFGPAMNVYPGPAFYNGLDEAGIERILTEHLAGGRPVIDLTRLPGAGGAASAPRNRDARGRRP